MATFMINRPLLKLLEYCVTYANFFKVIPCKWNYETSQVELVIVSASPKSSLNSKIISKFCWNFLWSRIVFVIHFIYALVRFPNALLTFNIGNMRTFMMELIFLISFSFIIVVQFTWAQHGSDLVKFTNNSLKYFRYIQETYSAPVQPNQTKTGKIKDPHWQLECLIVIIALFQGSIFTPFLISITFLRRPDMPCFITGLFFSNVSEFSIYSKLLLGVQVTWIFLSGWAGILCSAYLVFLPIYGSIFLLEELKPGRKTEFTSSQLRSPKIFKKSYQVIYLLYNLLNSITQDYMFMYANDVCITFAVWSNYFLICFHDKLAIESIVVACMLTIFPSGYLIVSYLKLGQINQKSKELLGAWKRFGKIIIQNSDFQEENRPIPKWLKSCRKIQIELGSFGHYQRPTSIRIIGKLLFYTVRFNLMMRKIFL